MARMILFIRHAATDLAGTFCGSSDPALNALGHAQVDRLKERLAESTPAPIHAVYTSDLLRARQTAEPLACAHQAALHLRPALRELHFGDWEGLTWAEIEARDPVYASKWIAEFPALPAPGGELIALFRSRVLAEFTALAKLSVPTQTTVVVTHAGPLRVLLEEHGHFAPQHAWERTRDYTSIIQAQHTSSGAFTIHS